MEGVVEEESVVVSCSKPFVFNSFSLILNVLKPIYQL